MPYSFYLSFWVFWGKQREAQKRKSQTKIKYSNKWKPIWRHALAYKPYSKANLLKEERKGELRRRHRGRQRRKTNHIGLRRAINSQDIDLLPSCICYSCQRAYKATKIWAYTQQQDPGIQKNRGHSWMELKGITVFSTSSRIFEGITNPTFELEPRLTESCSPLQTQSMTKSFLCQGLDSNMKKQWNVLWINWKLEKL